MMEIKTFDTILVNLCDDFDKLITPRKIARSNTNIIFLIFKAIAKGLEVINNVCVVLNNKFDPANCSEEDLVSVANLVGTEMLEGSGSGLQIDITNSTNSSITLSKGMYEYALDDDTSFFFEIVSDEGLTIEAEQTEQIIAMTNKVGVFNVTAQNTITVTADVIIPDGIKFSCADNTSLLGTEKETVIEFRKRILSDTDRQNSIIELQTELRNLPYIYDCRCIFNNTTSAVTYDEVTIPSGHMAIFYSGAPRNEMADIIARKILCPTVAGDNAVEVKYENGVFINGSQSYYLNPFSKLGFYVNVHCEIDTTIADVSEVHSQIRKIIFDRYKAKVHEDFIKENDIYNLLEDVNINGVELLGVDLVFDGATVDYIRVPLSRLADVTDVVFVE